MKYLDTNKLKIINLTNLTYITGLDNWELRFTLNCGVYSVQIYIEHDKMDKKFRLSIGGGEIQTFYDKESIVGELNTLTSVEKVYDEFMKRLPKKWKIDPMLQTGFFKIKITTRFGYKFEISYSQGSTAFSFIRNKRNLTGECGDTMESVIRCINRTLF